MMRLTFLKSVLSGAFSLFIGLPCLFSQEILSIDLSKIRASRYRLEFAEAHPSFLDEGTIHCPDITGDGVSEYCVVRSTLTGSTSNEITFNHLVKYTLFAKKFGRPISHTPFYFDIDGDGKKEFTVQETGLDTVCLHILNLEHETLATVIETNPGITTREWKCSLIPFGLMDCNHDGFQELLIIIETEEAYQPRGIGSFDIRNRRWVWRKLTGFKPMTPHLLDIDGDGPREIVFGSRAPDNGIDVLVQNCLVNGTDDRHLYLGVIDSLNTRQRRFKPFGEPYTMAALYAHDILNDGRKELIVNYTHAIRPAISLWDPESDSRHPIFGRPKTPIREIMFMDTDGDGKDNMILILPDGTLESVDSRLSVNKKVSMPDFQLSGAAVRDLDLNGEKELVLTGTHDSTAVALIIDRFFNIRAVKRNRAAMSWTVSDIADPGVGEKKWLILKDDRSHVYFYRIGERIPIPFTLPWAPVIAGAGAGMILILGFGSLYARRKRLKPLGSTLSTVFPSDVAYLVMDFRGRAFATNRLMEKWLEKPSEGILGRGYREILDSTPLSETVRDIDQSFENHQWTVERTVSLLRDGETHSIFMTVTRLPLDHGEPMGRLLSLKDMSSFVRSERAVAWAGMAQKLAHEIKTPLSTLTLAAEQLQLFCKKEFPEKSQAARYLEHIREQTVRITRLTNDFLKFARVEKPRLEPVSVNDVIHASLKGFELNTGKEMEIRTDLADALPVILADRNQLRIVLDNLIANAIHAMEGKGVLRVESRLLQPVANGVYPAPGEAVQIGIADTGRGISRTDINRLFQPFFTNSSGGTGMGLVIVKKIVEDHNGSIHVESEETIGTTVTVTLPVKGASSVAFPS